MANGSKGYSMIPNEIFDAELTENQKIVLMYLFRLGNNGAPIFPSYPTIGAKCGMSRPVAINTIRELESLGIISKKKRHGGSNEYCINRESLSLYIPSKESLPVKEPDPTRKESLPRPVKDIDPARKESLPQLVKDIDPINNNNINNSLKRTITNNADAHHPVMTFQLKDGSEYPVFEGSINEYKELYPYIEDIMQSFRSMRSWLIANPAKRKTKSGVWRFVNHWLKSDNEKAGTARARDKPMGKKPEAWESIDFASAGLEPMAPEGARLLPPGGTYAEKRKRYKELFMKNGIDMETRREVI